jgi:hypothetical protein
MDKAKTIRELPWLFVIRLLVRHAGNDNVTIVDRPADVVPWETSELSPELLQAIGQLAVSSAEFEDTCHHLYWKYARLNAISDPIITESLSPGRLSEDIVKFARNIERNKRRTEDIRNIFILFKKVAEERNSCIHWLWFLMIGENAVAARPMATDA